MLTHDPYFEYKCGRMSEWEFQQWLLTHKVPRKIPLNGPRRERILRSKWTRTSPEIQALRQEFNVTVRPVLREHYATQEIVRCHYCAHRLSLSQLTFDHVQSLCKGGDNTLSNIVPACKECNAQRNQEGY